MHTDSTTNQALLQSCYVFALDPPGGVILNRCPLSLLQSLDPLPMHGRDLGVNPDDLMETPELEQDAKQEILENKDVRSSRTSITVANHSTI